MAGIADLPPQWLAMGVGFFLLVVLIIVLVRLARYTAIRTAKLDTDLGQLTALARGLDASQQQLAGGLNLVSEQNLGVQARVMETLERRLEEVQKAMGETLHGTATRTARSLGELQQRLETIDRAQTKIEKLSGDVLGLQDILSNKQTRGAFGEIQLNDIVRMALPPDAYAFQVTLGNNSRADCLLYLPEPPGKIVIDAKFPLEAYEALRAANTAAEKDLAARQFRIAITRHVKAIAERYIIDGETADSALMFLPSEAVYAELHANFGALVRQGFEHRVWIVSPTTLMATLHTVRAVLKDVRMRTHAGAIRRELGLLAKDVERLAVRVGKLDTHFDQASRDIADIRISASKVSDRAQRLDIFEFENQTPDTEHVPPA